MSGFFSTPWTVARQAPLSMGFPRQEYWSGLPFPSQGDLPHPGIEPASVSCFAGGFFTTEPPENLGHSLLTLTGNCVYLRQLSTSTGQHSLLRGSVLQLHGVPLLRFFKNFIYLFIELHWVLVAASSIAASGLYFPDQGSKLGPLHWEHGVLATEPLEKSHLL